MSSTAVRAREAHRAEAPLAKYKAKRDFTRTTEPAGTVGRRKQRALGFVVQKHWASRLHYDFRLELDGVMVSWAVPKGPSFDPAVKQMAIQVEDHPISYNSFEGEIPAGHYGAGSVIVWDRGTWEPVGDPRQGLVSGKLVFHLHGQKLAGLWELVRISKVGEKKQDRWLLLKKRGDAWARPGREYDVIAALPDSVVQKPLGPIEAREPRAVPGPTSDAASDLSRAVKARFPDVLLPQLATLASAPPAEGDWIIENKWDGYRVLVRISGGKVQLFTRHGQDWSARLAGLVNEVEAMGIGQAWLDGEMVVMSSLGVPDFNALQNALDKAHPRHIELVLFDVPFLGDTDLRQVPLRSRRAVLRELLRGRDSQHIRFSEELPTSPVAVLHAACRLGLEGVMMKEAASAYVSRRSDTWLKLKCQRRQEFVVIGFTDRAGAPDEVGALILGYHDGAGQLRSAGSVGTGWTASQGRALHVQLARLQVSTPAVHETLPRQRSRRSGAVERWVQPVMVVEVVFGEWTPDGRVRHARFRGVRTDTPANSIVREAEAPPAAVFARSAANERTNIHVSHPDRVIDPSTGWHKIDLVRYYESVADRILPHLRHRPVSLVRAPQGVTGPLFFQKHAETQVKGLVELSPDLWPGHDSLLVVDSIEGLLHAAQLNVVEFHTWNATAKHIETPDRAVFDLDPGEGVGWASVREAAVLTRSVLEELGLRSWIKTSGGKGLHIVVPLAPKLDHGAVKEVSRAVVEHMARTLPQRFVAKSGGSNRVGKIFIDYLRNGHGQTTVAAFSARARPGLGVSMPISWEQLSTLKGGAQWTIATAREHLSFEKADPWADYGKSRQTLSTARKLLKLA